eukprot:2127889-Pyramimonas_sp.AAC.1
MFDVARGVKQGDVLSSLLFNAGPEQAARTFKLKCPSCGLRDASWPRRAREQRQVRRRYFVVRRAIRRGNADARRA